METERKKKRWIPKNKMNIRAKSPFEFPRGNDMVRREKRDGQKAQTQSERSL